MQYCAAFVIRRRLFHALLHGHHALVEALLHALGIVTGPTLADVATAPEIAIPPVVGGPENVAVRHVAEVDVHPRGFCVRVAVGLVHEVMAVIVRQVVEVRARRPSHGPTHRAGVELRRIDEWSINTETTGRGLLGAG